MCLEPPALVLEYCSRGSLHDVIQAARGSPMAAVELGWPRRLAMVRAGAAVGLVLPGEVNFAG